VKQKDFNVDDSRFQRLCSIESRYHHERGAQWRLALSHGLNTNWAKNLYWLFPIADDYYRVGFTRAEEEAQSIFLTRLRNPRGATTIRDMCRHLRESGVLKGSSPVTAYGQLLATRTLQANMDVGDPLDLPPSALRRTSSR
jgi:hypothetical protein